MKIKTPTRKRFIILLILLSIILCLLLTIPSCMEMFVPARFRTDYFKQTQLDATRIDDDYQFIQFEGNHYDLGLKMGAAFQELGLDLVEIPPGKKRHYLAQLETISHYKPEWIDYCRGIAAAYKLEYEEASKKYNLFPIAMNIHFSCSAVFVNSKATIQKENYVARNFDFPEMHGNLWRTRLKNTYQVIGHDTHFCYPALMDGMNEYGLSVILNAVTDTTHSEKKWAYPLPEYTGIEACYFTRMILETCKDAEEARSLIKKIPVFSEGPPSHFLVADKQGDSFIVEFSYKSDGRATIIERPSNKYYQILTNFNMNTNGYNGNLGYKEGPCVRYAFLDTYFGNIGKSVSMDSIHDALYAVRMSEQTSEMAQGFTGISTQIQLIYNLNQLKAVVYFPSSNSKDGYTINLKR